MLLITAGFNSVSGLVPFGSLWIAAQLDKITSKFRFN